MHLFLTFVNKYMQFVCTCLQIHVIIYLIIYERGASVWWRGSSRDGAVAYMQPTTQAGTRKAPQCGGALACESKFQGKFAGCDCSNYQLFRCSSWDGFYRLIFHLSH